MLDLAMALALARQCAPTVAPLTLVSVARAESGLDPLAIGVNGPSPHALHPATREEARRKALALLASGADLDLGLSQINARNLRRLRMSLDAAFDPCRSLEAGARILADAYVARLPATGRTSATLKAALSTYNTGHPARGLANGYVARVYRAAGEVASALDTAPSAGPAGGANATPVRLRAAMEAPSSTLAFTRCELPGATDVFARASSVVLVWGAPSAATSPRPPPPTPGDPS